MRRATLIVLVCALVGGAMAPAAQAAGAPVGDVQVPLYPAPSLTTPAAGLGVTPARAIAVAKTSPTMQAIHRGHHPLQIRVFFWLKGHYEVFFFFKGKPIGDVVVTRNGHLGPTYTGPLILGIYGRGHYGDVFDSPWVFVPFGLMFLLPLMRLRRARWLDRADLAAVLTFFVSYALFDYQHLELGVWMAYPPLAYLLIRMLIRGFRPGSLRARLDVGLPTWILAGGLLALVAGRIVVTLLPAMVMDVGYASVIGASKILHGQSVYFASAGHPDTYGPITYLAYAPFEAIWPTASWNYALAARVAAVSFDLLTIGGLMLIGVRLRAGREGRRLGLLLAWLWAACPFTVLGMVKSTNDGLVALFVVLAMLSLTRPIRRGVLLGLGAAAKFFPAILLPLMAAGRRGGDERHARRVLAGFVIAAGTSVAIFLPPGGIKEMWDHTIGYQLTRTDMFSPWALHPGLAPVKVALELGVGILALIVAFRPRGPRTLAQVSALAAALIVAVQLPAVHWFYFYIVWFMPLVLIAVLGAGADAPQQPEAAAEISDAPAKPEPEPEPEPALVGAS